MPESASAEKTNEARTHKKAANYVMRPVHAVAWQITRIAAFFNRHNASFSALATLVIAGLTFVYVHYSKQQWATMSDQLAQMRIQSNVMSTQAQIAAIALAPRVIVRANRPKPEGNISFVFTNVGNSTGYRVVIAANLMWRVPTADFDPFKSSGGTELQAQTIDQLLPGETAGSDYLVTQPSTGESLYVYGTYGYETRLPDLPKENIRFCYIARDNGTIEPCKTFHVLSLHASMALKGLGVSAQTSIATPTVMPGAKKQSAKKRR